MTDSDIEQYVEYLKNLDPNTTGYDDAVRASDIITLVEHARKLSLKRIATPVNAVKTVDVVKGYFNTDGTVKTDKKYDLQAAVSAFDKLNDAYDIKVTNADLRTFARTYGLNATQKEALEALYPALENVFGS